MWRKVVKAAKCGERGETLQKLCKVANSDENWMKMVKVEIDHISEKWQKLAK